MKTLLRYLFLVLILAGTVSSCDWYSDPLELVYPGTDLSGKPDQGEEDENVKLVTDFENVLSSVWNGGWKITGTTDENDELSVYFIFDVEAGTYVTKSTLYPAQKEGEYKITVNENKQLEFNLSDSDIKYFGDETLVIGEVTDGTIACTGAETGKSYKMITASQSEIDEVADALMKDIRTAGWNMGVIRRQAGNFMAYYYMDDTSIYFVGFNKDAKKVVRVTNLLTKDGADKYVWESPFSVGNAAISGIQYNEETQDVTLIGMDGDADLKLVKNISVDKDGTALSMKDWLSKTGTAEFKGAELILTDDLKADYDKIPGKILEWNGSWGAIVAYYDNYYFIKYNRVAGVFPVDGTDILHIPGDLEAGFGSDIKVISSNYPTLYNFLVEQNHIVVRDGEAKDSPILMLSVSSDQFIYWPKADIPKEG